MQVGSLTLEAVISAGSKCSSSVFHWGAWLEKSVDYGVQRHRFRVGKAMMGPVQMTTLCQEEHEEGQKQEHKYMKHHKDPRSLK